MLVGRTRVIVAELDRPACTIRREIVRNGGRAKYTADRADRRAKRERCRPKQSRSEADPDLGVYVAGRLGVSDGLCKWSGRHLTGEHTDDHGKNGSGTRGVSPGSRRRSRTR